jgi:hypothetical protein
MFDIDPKGYVTAHDGTKIPTILCHADSYKLGFGSNHGDVNHWFPKFDKSMATVREDVAALLVEEKPSIVIPSAPAPNPVAPDLSNCAITQEQFNAMMNNYLTSLAQ